MRGKRGRDEVSTLSKVRRSYSLSCLDSIPAANINPSASKLATGRPLRCMSPWQFGERRSHSRIVRSSDPDKNMSLIGHIINVTTLGGRRGYTHTYYSQLCTKQ